MTQTSHERGDYSKVWVWSQKKPNHPWIYIDNREQTKVIDWKICALWMESNGKEGHSCTLMQDQTMLYIQKEDFKITPKLNRKPGKRSQYGGNVIPVSRPVKNLPATY